MKISQRRRRGLVAVAVAASVIAGPVIASMPAQAASPVSATNVVTAPAQATPVGVQNNGKTPTDISTKTESYTKIAGERVVPGQQLSEKQMAVIGMSKSMGNN